MPDKDTEQVEIGNAHRSAARFFYNAKGQQVVVGPGQVVEATVTKAYADKLRARAKRGENGDDLIMKGTTVRRDADEDNMSRAQIEEEERKELEAGAKAERARPRPRRSADADEDDDGDSGNEKKSKSELQGMTKDDLASYAESIGAEVSAASTKDEMIAGIQKAQRKH